MQPIAPSPEGRTLTRERAKVLAPISFKAGKVAPSARMETMKQLMLPNEDDDPFGSDSKEIKDECPGPFISLEEVEQHNTEEDCWMIVEHNVYDITEYAQDHPGGDVIYSEMGTDATEAFSIFPNFFRALFTRCDIISKFSQFFKKTEML